MLEQVRVYFFLAIFDFASAKLNQVILGQRSSSRARAHGCCDFWQVNIQKPLRLFQMNHCINAHQCRLGSMVFCLHSVRHFANQLFEIVS